MTSEHEDASLPLGAEPDHPSPAGCRRWLKRGCLAYGAVILVAIPLMVTGQYFGYLGPRGGWDSQAAIERSRLQRCVHNLQQLDQSLRNYTALHRGHYPASLQELVRVRLLPSIPTCPSHSGAAYSNYVTDAQRIAYSVACVGHYHEYLFQWRYEEAENNLPRISSEGGLTDRPAR